MIKIILSVKILEIKWKNNYQTINKIRINLSKIHINQKTTLLKII